MYVAVSVERNCYKCTSLCPWKGTVTSVRRCVREKELLQVYVACVRGKELLQVYVACVREKELLQVYVACVREKELLQVYVAVSVKKNCYKCMSLCPWKGTDTSVRRLCP